MYVCANASCNSISHGGRGNSNCFIGGLDSEIFTGLNYYQRLLVLQGLANELGKHIIFQNMNTQYFNHSFSLITLYM